MYLQSAGSKKEDKKKKGKKGEEKGRPQTANKQQQQQRQQQQWKKPELVDIIIKDADQLKTEGELFSLILEWIESMLNSPIISLAFTE